MAEVSVEEFLDTLEKSNLLSETDVAHMTQLAGQLGSPESLAKHLISEGLLTRWQALQMLSGRYSFYLGRYKLLDRLGQGKYGIVFKAQQAAIGRIVALKVMSNKALAHPRAVARFEREIRVAATLDHPNIVKAYDAEQIGDTHFLVMEFVEGRDLKAWISDFGRLPIDWTVDVILQGARALEHAEVMGLVHRDIKPSNLMVTAADTSSRPMVKLLDMGLARVVSPDGQHVADRITKTGHVVGTVDFIAPEQIENSKSVDIRADIYGLGCTLFKAITGHVPFEGRSIPEKVLARMRGDAPLVRTLRTDVPEGLEEVIAKMLARDVNDRYQSPHEVIEALLPFSMSHSTPMDVVDMSADPTIAFRPKPNDRERIDYLERTVAMLELRLAEVEQALHASRAKCES